MKGIKRMLGGLLCIIVGLYVYTIEYFRNALLELINVMLGSVGLIFIFTGIILVIIGVSSRR